MNGLAIKILLFMLFLGSMTKHGAEAEHVVLHVTCMWGNQEHFRIDVEQDDYGVSAHTLLEKVRNKKPEARVLVQRRNIDLNGRMTMETQFYGYLDIHGHNSGYYYNWQLVLYSIDPPIRFTNNKAFLLRAYKSDEVRSVKLLIHMMWLKEKALEINITHGLAGLTVSSLRHEIRKLNPEVEYLVQRRKLFKYNINGTETANSGFTTYNGIKLGDDYDIQHVLKDNDIPLLLDTSKISVIRAYKANSRRNMTLFLRRKWQQKSVPIIVKRCVTGVAVRNIRIAAEKVDPRVKILTQRRFIDYKGRVAYETSSPFLVTLDGIRAERDFNSQVILKDEEPNMLFPEGVRSVIWGYESDEKEDVSVRIHLPYTVKFPFHFPISQGLTGVSVWALKLQMWRNDYEDIEFLTQRTRIYAQGRNTTETRWHRDFVTSQGEFRSLVDAHGEADVVLKVTDRPLFLSSHYHLLRAHEWCQ